MRFCVGGFEARSACASFLGVNPGSSASDFGEMGGTLSAKASFRFILHRLLSTTLNLRSCHE